ncbi:MAG: hypothetical protein EKK41_21195 [Hyphomicrobiales bacterium]|nr:MAG: hypothetical protein EKK41_21195 [Hyphomicrobiales bacterium]
MSRDLDQIAMLAVKARLRTRRVNGAKCRIRLAMMMEEKATGKPLPPGLSVHELRARLQPHWIALGYCESEWPSDRQLKYATTGR